MRNILWALLSMIAAIWAAALMAAMFWQVLYSLRAIGVLEVLTEVYK